MAKLSSIDIKGLWGSRSINIDIFPDVNIFIGENGSGKTTIIQIVAAAMHGDLRTLARLPFETVRLTFSDESNRKPSVEVRRASGLGMGKFVGLSFAVRSKASDKKPTILECTVDAEEGDLVNFHGNDSLEEDDGAIIQRHGIALRRPMGRTPNSMRRALDQIIRVRWLSIHRTQTHRSEYGRPGIRRAERSFESSVDRKLTDLAIELSRYIATLESEARSQMKKFQQAVLFSLLHDPNENKVRQLVKAIDVNSEREALSSIFKQFDLPEQGYRDALTSHFKKLSLVVCVTRCAHYLRPCGRA